MQAVLLPVNSRRTAPRSGEGWQKARLFRTTNVDARAVCLDGSPGSFYFSPAPTQSRNWLIYFSGGGWCSLDVPINSPLSSTVDHCYMRAFSSLGSSLKLPQIINFSYPGFLSRSSHENPHFSDWNMAVLNYCDGLSFSGRRPSSLNLTGPYGQKEIFLRGGFVREAAHRMLADLGLSSAKNVLISGSSAGGLAAFLSIQWWSAALPSSYVFGLADSGFFMEWSIADNSTTAHDTWIQVSLSLACSLARSLSLCISPSLSLSLPLSFSRSRSRALSLSPSLSPSLPLSLHAPLMDPELQAPARVHVPRCRGRRQRRLRTALLRYGCKKSPTKKAP